MENFLATKVDEQFIELSSSDEIEKLYEMLDKDENFILQWKEGDVMHSKLVLATNSSSKVKNGEIELKSKEVNRRIGEC